MPLPTNSPTSDWTNALGASEVFLDFQENLARIADSERPVLILGERGTGKELAARSVHYLSRRWDKPLITLLCTALSPSLLEAELFGYEKGAFTGAYERRRGYFEYASQGTLFLDEVADMPLSLQDRLLRVLEYQRLRRVGGNAEISVDVRVVAATNRDIESLVKKGSFRADLLDRLACQVVHVPPLKLRGEDIIILARHFAGKFAVELGQESLPDFAGEIRFAAVALKQLRDYAWPGNVRELKNVIERSLLQSRGKKIDFIDFSPFTPPWTAEEERAEEDMAETDQKENKAMPHTVPGTISDADIFLEDKEIPANFSLPEAIKNFEKNAVLMALKQTKFRQNKAARLLGLSYAQFRALHKRMRLEYPALFSHT